MRYPSTMKNATENLEGLRVAVIATDGFEEKELTEPVRALRDAGAEVDVVSEECKPIQAFHHHDKSITVDVDRALDEVSLDEYDALMLPGGALNADAMRMNESLRSLIKDADAAKKPIAAICHAPWELVSAGVLHGRKLTSYHTIQDDLRNAGAQW